MPAVLKIKSIETILPSQSLLKFSIDDDKRREGLTRIQTPLLGVVPWERNITTPLASPDPFIVWFGIDLLQAIKLAILVFEITKDSSF